MVIEGTYTYTITDHGMRKQTIQRVVSMSQEDSVLKLTTKEGAITEIHMGTVRSIQPQFVRKHQEKKAR